MLAEASRQKNASARAQSIRGSDSNSSINNRLVGSDGGADAYSASRTQHTRHLVLQYLSCKDKDVRVHMEDALMALFRVNESERLAILTRRKFEEGGGGGESYVSMSSISSMFGEAILGLGGASVSSLSSSSAVDSHHLNVSTSSSNSSNNSSHGLLAASSRHGLQNGNRNNSRS